MKPSPAFQFYPQDFLVGTADLTAEETGGYIRLLCYQWAKGSIPDDNKKLSQLSGITDGLSLGNVSVKFRLCQDGLKRNDRLESIRLEQEEYRKKQAQNGSKGGNPNFQAGKHNPYYKPKDNPPHNPPHNPKINSSPSSSPSINTEEGFEIPKSLENPEFHKTWNEWREFRLKMKACKDWPTLFKKQLQQLEGYGVHGAIQSLNASMAGGWQGLFEPKSNGDFKSKPMFRRRSLQEIEAADEAKLKAGGQ